MPVGAVPSFGMIEEPHKDFYTERQRKLANYVKDVVNLTNPEDKKGRSYADFLKEEHDLDLYIKARRDTNSIVLYSKNKDDELDIIKNYKKGFKPKEADFVSYIEFLKEYGVKYVSGSHINIAEHQSDCRRIKNLAKVAVYQSKDQTRNQNCGQISVAT